jgi:DNA-binding transcriptional ArsR family regulator
MIQKTKQADQEFAEIKKKLSEVQNDLKRFIEQSNKQQLELILASSRKEMANAMIGYVVEDAQKSLDDNMVKRCGMRDKCRTKFMEFLEKNAGALRQDRVSSEAIIENRSALSTLKDHAPHKKCDICFTEVNGLFDKQVSLMKSLQIYDPCEPKAVDVTTIPEKDVVAQVLEPISNKTRIQILKALYYDTKTFTALAELTGFRAGNLLFHLQKLMGSGMIIQRHEGGDYMITDKGYKVLIMINEVYGSLNNR